MNMIDNGRYAREPRRGYYTGLYMALFMPLGIALWLVTDNPGLIGAGAAVGIALGALIEQRRLRGSNPADRERPGFPLSAALCLAGALGTAALIILLLLL